jgi:hypothetical protein
MNETFKLTTGTSAWEFLPGHQHLLDIQLSEIAAIIERKP